MKRYGPLDDPSVRTNILLCHMYYSVNTPWVYTLNRWTFCCCVVNELKQIRINKQKGILDLTWNYTLSIKNSACFTVAMCALLSADVNFYFCFPPRWWRRIFPDTYKHLMDNWCLTHTSFILSFHRPPFSASPSTSGYSFGSSPDQWRSVHKPARRTEQTWWKWRANLLGEPSWYSFGSLERRRKDPWK